MNYFASVMAGIFEDRIVCPVAGDGPRVLGHASILPVTGHRQKRPIGRLGMVARPDHWGRLPCSFERGNLYLAETVLPPLVPGPD